MSEQFLLCIITSCFSLDLLLVTILLGDKNTKKNLKIYNGYILIEFCMARLSVELFYVQNIVLISNCIQFSGR